MWPALGGRGSWSQHRMGQGNWVSHVVPRLLRPWASASLPLAELPFVQL